MQAHVCWGTEYGRIRHHPKALIQARQQAAMWISSIVGKGMDAITAQLCTTVTSWMQHVDVRRGRECYHWERFLQHHPD